MADEKKKISLGGLDSAAEEKGSLMKTIWQIVKFVVVSGLVTIIQLVLAYLLPFIFDKIQTALPHFLQVIFNPNTIFDIGEATTLSAVDPKVLKDITKYVLDANIISQNGLPTLTGIITWGYVLPFLLSNLIANIYGYIQNKKTTFKSDAPTYCFVIYIILMICLILFSTWLQGWIFGLICSNLPKLAGLARLIAAMAAGFVQMLVLFPMEKFVLLREKKEDGEAAADKNAEATKDAE
ncbi:MAG: hypothetical protein K5917_01855 [Clostridiales bacterium]|nr:hypothetical protein [Clostridiales bacterium]